MLQELLEKKFLSVAELEQIEESEEVISVECCGVSGQYPNKLLYTVSLVNGEEIDIYLER